MRVPFTPQADRQYIDALRFIRAKSPAGAASIQRLAETVVAQLGLAQPGLGHEFLNEVESALGVIVEHPAASPTGLGQTRAHTISRFPYSVMSPSGRTT